MNSSSKEICNVMDRNVYRNLEFNDTEIAIAVFSEGKGFCMKGHQPLLRNSASAQHHFILNLYKYQQPPRNISLERRLSTRSLDQHTHICTNTFCSIFTFSYLLYFLFFPFFLFFDSVSFTSRLLLGYIVHSWNTWHQFLIYDPALLFPRKLLPNRQPEVT